MTDNRRSPQSIIDIFSKVRRSDDSTINSVDCQDLNNSIIVYKYSSTNHQLIIKHYDDYCATKKHLNSCIVVRGNSLKDSLLGKKLEQRPWSIELPKEIIYAKNLFISGDIKNAIKEIRAISIQLIYAGTTDYHVLKAVILAFRLPNKVSTVSST